MVQIDQVRAAWRWLVQFFALPPHRLADVSVRRRTKRISTVKYDRP